jgi:hypothetical protein
MKNWLTHLQTYCGFIVSGNVADAVICVGLESVTVNVTMLVPAAVGVPLVPPVNGLIPKPGGRPDADHR